jgi:alkylhydroperoxidase family enzyme
MPPLSCLSHHVWRQQPRNICTGAVSLARVDLIDPAGRPELKELAAQFSGARRGNLLNIYRVLLHNPALAEAWFCQMNAVRWKTSLDGRLRELLIIRIGHVNRAAYILKQHVPKLAEADGVSAAECDALEDWQSSSFFDPRERAALAYADAVTRDCAVPDDVFAALEPHFDQQAIVEITVLIGAYNMHARVMGALAVDLEKD